MKGVKSCCKPSYFSEICIIKNKQMENTAVQLYL